MDPLSLRVLDGLFSVCRLPSNSEWKPPVCASFWSATRTANEWSLVVPQDMAPAAGCCERGWCILQVQGPLDFALVGILAELSHVLAEADVSIFSLSTYDTDHILVRSNDLAKARVALVRAGHKVDGSPLIE